MRTALRTAAGTGLVSATTLLLAGCTTLTASAQLTTVPAAPTSRAQVTAQPAGPGKVRPDTKVIVTASNGQLSTVSVTGPKGRQLRGTFSTDGSTWTADDSALDYGTTYSVQATAVDSRGVPVQAQESFTTDEPSATFSATVTPEQGTVVGVGTPIVVAFDHDIRPAQRADVERALVVRTSTPIVGAWSWTGPREVRFRPVNYWPGHMQVQVQTALTGVEGAPGVFGAGTATTSFATGPATVIKVDAQTHKAQVWTDGVKVRTIPVTTGKPGFDTRSGTVIITTKEPTRIMDAATGGTDPTDPEYYRIEVHYAMRITSSGEFLHAAPWSVYAQGRANVSHGCIGMSTDNAAWLFDHANLGDVVEITGTPVPQNLGNGVTVWQNTWDEWLVDSKAGSVATQPLDPDIPPVAETSAARTDTAPAPSASASASASASGSSITG